MDYLRIDKRFFKIGLNSVDILILAYIDQYTKQGLDCEVSNQFLSDFTGVSIRTVTRSIKKLEELNYIIKDTFKVKNRGQKSNVRMLSINYNIIFGSQYKDEVYDEPIMGIYKIENIDDGKVYIGRSKNIKRRWIEHQNMLANHEHHSYKLQQAYDGADNKNIFQFSIIEEVEDTNDLANREQYWMDYYDAYYNGYNCCAMADNPKYKKK